MAKVRDRRPNVPVEPIPTEQNPWPEGLRVYGRRGTKFARTYGRVKGYRRCQLQGCRGLQLRIVWADGHYTWCCTKGLENHRGGMRLM